MKTADIGDSRQRFQESPEPIFPISLSAIPRARGERSAQSPGPENSTLSFMGLSKPAAPSGTFGRPLWKALSVKA